MNYLIVGGAGFIGSHLVKALEADGERVRVYDRQTGDDVHDMHRLIEAARGQDVIVHLASNADISKGATEPGLDWFEGTVLTRNVAEAARIAHVPAIWYASGSGVYGDRHGERSDEQDRLEPISHYGASKVCGEAILRAYSHMHGITVRAFRFANVVGPGQTHGVCVDFMRQLAEHPDRLTVLSDGSPTKAYLHVDDAIDAMRATADGTGFEVFDVTNHDEIAVAYIAGMACAVSPGAWNAQIDYGPKPEGWKGDVPLVALCSRSLHAYGWYPKFSSGDAVQAALEAMR